MGRFVVISRYGWKINENSKYDLLNCAEDLDIELPEDINLDNVDHHDDILYRICSHMHKFINWSYAVDKNSSTKILGIPFRDETHDDFQRILNEASEDIEFLERYFGPARFIEVVSEF